MHELGQEIEAGGLARAVRADQRVNRAAGNAQIDAVDRNEAGKFLGEILGLEDEIVAHEAPALLVDRSVSTFATRSAKRPACGGESQDQKMGVDARRRQRMAKPAAALRVPAALPEAF